MGKEDKVARKMNRCSVQDVFTPMLFWAQSGFAFHECILNILPGQNEFVKTGQIGCYIFAVKTKEF